MFSCCCASQYPRNGSLIRGRVKLDPSRILKGQFSSCACAASYFCQQGSRKCVGRFLKSFCMSVFFKVYIKGLYVCAGTVNNLVYFNHFKPAYILAAFTETSEGEGVLELLPQQAFQCCSNVK